MTAADPGPQSDGPSRSVEIEVKFDAEDDTPLPDWTALPGVASVGTAEPRDLDARYYDTAEFALAVAGYALRRRSGGPDAGWHLKGPRRGGGRVELGWPLGPSEDEDVPDAVRASVATVTEGELRPIARILNSRTAYALRAADGELVGEFVDDRVTATDLRTERRPLLARVGGRARACRSRRSACVLHCGGGRRPCGGRPGCGIRLEARPRARVLTPAPGWWSCGRVPERGAERRDEGLLRGALRLAALAQRPGSEALRLAALAQRPGCRSCGRVPERGAERRDEGLLRGALRLAALAQRPGSEALRLAALAQRPGCRSCARVPERGAERRDEGCR